MVLGCLDASIMVQACRLVQRTAGPDVVPVVVSLDGTKVAFGSTPRKTCVTVFRFGHAPRSEQRIGTAHHLGRNTPERMMCERSVCRVASLSLGSGNSP
eukprot:SAG31_NODE_19659_length_595_cov_0.933468_2_plen_98_part_01